MFISPFLKEQRFGKVCCELLWDREDKTGERKVGEGGLEEGDPE